MKMITGLSVCLFALLLGLAGCSSAREKAANETVDIFSDLVDQLQSIKSNADFVDAKPKLEKLGARLKDQMKKMKDLGKPTADEQKSLEAEYKPKMDKVQARLKDEINRLSKDMGPGAPMEIFAALKVDFSEMEMK
jgi:hypothetical protein